MPFDPQHLTPAASLNRVRIVNLPGFDLSDEVRGKTGYELISTQFLTAQILKVADQLKLTSDELGGTRSAVPLVLNRCLLSEDRGVRAAAEGVVRTLAHNIAYLLLTLKRGDLVNRQARPDWESADWEHWADLRRVWIGGGLLSGELGRRILPYIHDVFAAARHEVYEVAIDPHGAALPLVGAARYGPAGALGVLLLDFGSSFIKRACGVYDGDTLSHLLMLPTLPAPYDPGTDTQDSAMEVFGAIVDVFLESWRYLIVEHGVTPARVIPTCLAAYVEHGQVSDRQGGRYTLLRQITDNAERTLTSVLAAQLHAPVEVRLLHDGSAAAAAYAGEQRAAVITIGTSLGVGFPPPVEGLRAIRRPVKISTVAH